MKATDPDGVTYRVGRRWLPWRWRKRFSGRPWDVEAFDFLDGVDSFLVSIVVTVVLVFVIPIVILVLLTGVEFLLLLVLLPIAVAGRMLFGRHWHVEVRRGLQAVSEVDGGSWSQSRLVIADIAEQIRLGRLEAAAGRA